MCAIAFAPVFRLSSPRRQEPSDVRFWRGVSARVPPTRRAFRRPAGRRVTFLLRAQKKSNPKKTAFRAKAHSSTADRSVGRLVPAGTVTCYLKRRRYTATRHGGEDLKRGGGASWRFRKIGPSPQPSPRRGEGVEGALCSRASVHAEHQFAPRPKL